MSDNISERLKQFLEQNNLTASKFSEILGVQKSSISHILSGRNKPSFDFLLKFKEKFPDLDLEWLITGKKDHNNSFIKSYDTKINKEVNNNQEEENNSPPFSSTQRKTNEIYSIDSVMIIFKDDTFKLIKPRKQ